MNNIPNVLNPTTNNSIVLILDKYIIAEKEDGDLFYLDNNDNGYELYQTVLEEDLTPITTLNVKAIQEIKEKYKEMYGSGL